MSKYHFSFQEVFKFGWAKTKQHAWFLVLTFIIASIITSAVKFMPVLSCFVGLMVGLSIASISLLIVRDQHFTFHDLVAPLLSAKKVLKMFVLTSIYIVAVGIGTIFLIIPGIYVAVRFKFFPYVVLENENATIKELIAMTYKLTGGYFWNVALFLVLAIILNILGALFFLVGLIVTVPVTVLASAHFYLKIKEHTV